jgi:peroxiredoxin Q/BCP
MSAKKVSVRKKSAKKSSAKSKPVRKTSAKKVVSRKKGAVKKTLKKKVVKKTSGKKVSTSKIPNKKRAIKKVLALKVGDRAPDFSLLNQNGARVSLKDFAGKQHIVLYFYPKAMTPGCTVQACSIRDHAEDFQLAGAVVLGVSPDKVPALAKFRERDQLNFDLLSDESKDLAKRYGVWGLKKFMGREFMGVRRWTFIIGRDGLVKHVMDQVKTQTHHDDVLALLKSI